MGALSELAAKYARQLDNVKDLERHAALASANAESELRDAEETANAMRALVFPLERLSKLVPAGKGRFVLMEKRGHLADAFVAVYVLEVSE